MTRRRSHKTPHAIVGQQQHQQQGVPSAKDGHLKSHQPIVLSKSVKQLTAQIKELCVTSPTSFLSSEIVIKQTKPRVPLEIVEQILQSFYDEVNPESSPWWETAKSSNSRFIKLSLVCKTWNAATRVFRTSLVLGSEKSAKLFMNRMRKFSMQFKRLHYSTPLSTEILDKLTPFVSGKLVSLSIPLGMLHTKHVYDIFKRDVNPVTSAHIHGKISEDYTGTFWQKAYILHDVDTLRELTLSNIKIKGAFRAFQAAVKSPIERLHLIGLEPGLTVESTRHLCWPLMHHLKHFTCTGLEYLTICEMMHILVTPQLESFESKSTFSHYVGSDTDTIATAYSKAASWKTLPYHLKVDLANSRAVCNGELVEEAASAHFMAALSITQYAAAKANETSFWRGVDILLPTVLGVGLTTSKHVVYNKVPSRLETHFVLDTHQKEKLKNAWCLLNGTGPLTSILRISDEPPIYEITESNWTPSEQ